MSAPPSPILGEPERKQAVSGPPGGWGPYYGHFHRQPSSAARDALPPAPAARPRPAGRAWVAGVAGVVIVYFYIKGLIAIGHGEAQDARDLWSYLVLFLLLLIVVIAPRCSPRPSRRSGSSRHGDSLTSTNLTAGEVLLGKWLARLSMTALPVGILLPFLIGCSPSRATWALSPTWLFWASSP